MSPVGAAPPDYQPDFHSLPWTAKRLLLSGLMICVLCFETFKATARYMTHGPPKPTWTYGMTLIVAWMQVIERYQSVISVQQIRCVRRLSLELTAALSPATNDAVNRVKLRRGKDQSSHLECDWLAHKDVAQAADSVTPKRVVFFLHGGAFMFMSTRTHRHLASEPSKAYRAHIFMPEYRLAPEHPFPAMLEDAVLAYSYLVNTLAIPPSQIIIMGDSCGGALAMGLLFYLRDDGLSRFLPRCAVLKSPWCDMTNSSDSWRTNAAFDWTPNPVFGSHLCPSTALLPRHITSSSSGGLTNEQRKECARKLASHPYLSPLWGTFEDLPPLLVQSGDCERLADEIDLFVRKVAAASDSNLTRVGVKRATPSVTHQVYEDGVHIFQTFGPLASRRAGPCRPRTRKAQEGDDSIDSDSGNIAERALRDQQRWIEMVFAAVEDDDNEEVERNEDSDDDSDASTTVGSVFDEMDVKATITTKDGVPDTPLTPPGDQQDDGFFNVGAGEKTVTETL